MLDQVEQLDEVKNDKHKYWKMLNGHALFNDRIGELKLDNDETKIKVKNALKVGVHWDTQVLDDKEKCVAQMFCSALPLHFSTFRYLTDDTKVEPFARLIC